MIARDQDPERIAAEQVRGDLGRGQRGPADSDVQAAVDELLVLLGHGGFDLMNDQAGVPGLNLVQDLRHRVVAGVDDPDPQRGRGAGRAAGDHRGPVHSSQDLTRLSQEHDPGGGQGDVVGGAF